MPAWLLLTLVAIGLPRTILADLDIVPPESGLLYYFLALAPFAAWLAVAVLRETRKPIMDFLVLGSLYGLSLAVVHHALWNADAGYGNRPPAGAVGFAGNFSPALQDLALHGYTIMIAMAIGLGSGLAVAVAAWVAGKVRAKRHDLHRKFTA
ncbi:hypothetical protein [Thermoactinospora rubra]|uniref:hypothetical protein n=1 Tax=Thermoactinospora rubra TaxID=1088767 RepID=UPI00117D8B57|nr:hypothetical protein [Thermoactinospora rubra]